MRSHSITLIVIVGIGLCSFGCGVTQPVRVLDEGTTQITGSLGGPFIPVGNTTIPVPYLNVGIMNGYTENVTLSGNLHVLALLFGVAGLDAGIATTVVKQKELIPEMTAKVQVLLFNDFRDGFHPRLYPQITLNGSYHIGESSLVYLGADNVFQSGSPGFLFNPFIGYQFPLGRNWNGQIESKWMAANINTSRGIFEGRGGISNDGNTSIFIGLLYLL